MLLEEIACDIIADSVLPGQKIELALDCSSSISLQPGYSGID